MLFLWLYIVNINNKQQNYVKPVAYRSVFVRYDLGTFKKTVYLSLTGVVGTLGDRPLTLSQSPARLPPIFF